LPRLVASAAIERNLDAAERTARMIRSTDPATIAATQRIMADRADMTPDLPHVTCPTLAIGGDLDVITPPEEMMAMAALMPDARFVRIPASGHMAPLENPSDVNRVIEGFLIH
jgi:pimeloyl-ACP methyl ester carboxylesterase